MVRTFLQVYMELGSYFLFLQEQIKDIIIISREFDPQHHRQRTLHKMYLGVWLRDVGGQ